MNVGGCGRTGEQTLIMEKYWDNELVAQGNKPRAQESQNQKDKIGKEQKD